MNGSEKQVRWAEDIKAKFNEDMTDRFAELDKLFSKLPEEKKAEVGPVLDAEREVVSKINAQEDAKFWIDNRNQLGKHFVEEVRTGKRSL